MLFAPDAPGPSEAAGSGPKPVPGVVWPYTHRPEPHLPDVYRDAIGLLVDRGFAVLVPGNRPGPFSEAVAADVAASGRWLASHEATDGRVAVLGHSTGGYDALLQAASHPSVWEVAVASNAPTDLLALDEHRDGPADLRNHLPDPAERPDAWRDRSPLHRADAVECPVLVVHAEHDRRVPLAQAQRLVQALRDAATAERDVEFAVLDGQGHFSRAVADRTARWRRILDFFDEQL